MWAGNHLMFVKELTEELSNFDILISNTLTVVFLSLCIIQMFLCISVKVEIVSQIWV